MDPFPGFTVRSYASFKLARLYRVLVSGDALYFVRLRGLISPGEPVWEWIDSIVRRSLSSQLFELEQRNPEELVRSSAKHFKLDVSDLTWSSLERPGLLLRPGDGIVCWKVVARDTRQHFQFEDVDSLATALLELPAVLGSRLTVKLRPTGRMAGSKKGGRSRDWCEFDAASLE